MGAWWPATHHIAKQPFTAVVVEPHAGGRWYERDASGESCDWGTVLAWEPPQRVVLSWQLGTDWKFIPDVARGSEVEIRFTALSPTETRVDLEHRALERHGEGYEKLRESVEAPQGWTGVLEQFTAFFNREEVR
jgi:uncharacterized protein YndB with AHSA1/START domain